MLIYLGVQSLQLIRIYKAHSIFKLCRTELVANKRAYSSASMETSSATKSFLDGIIPGLGELLCLGVGRVFTMFSLVNSLPFLFDWY